MKIDRSLSKLALIFVLLKTIFHFVYTRVNIILTDGVNLYIYGIFSGHYLTTFVTIAIIIVMKGI